MFGLLSSFVMAMASMQKVLGVMGKVRSRLSTLGVPSYFRPFIQYGDSGPHGNSLTRW